MLVSEDKVREELKKVIDPELFVNIVDLGLIYNIDITEAAEGNAGMDSGADVPDGGETPTDAPVNADAPVTANTPAPSAETASPGSPGESSDASTEPTTAASEEPYDGPMAHVAIEMTMTSPACPAGPQLIGGSKNVVSRMKEVKDVEVKLVMDPPWTPDRMTEDARDQLGIF